MSELEYPRPTGEVLERLEQALREAGMPAEDARYTRLISDIDARRVGLDHIGRVKVSTVLMPGMGGEPDRWETEVSGLPNGDERYPWSEERDARANHDRIVAYLHALRHTLNGAEE